MVSHRPAVFKLVKKVIIAMLMLNPLKCGGVRHLHLKVFSALPNTGDRRYNLIFNPLKGRDFNWLHLAIQVLLTFLISDIQALRHSGLSARVPECQKLKM